MKGRREILKKAWWTSVPVLASVGCMLTPLAAVAAIQFSNVTGSAGPFHTGESWGASWGDYNGDGWLDLFVNNHRDRPSVWRNNGNGTFTDMILQVDVSRTWRNRPFGDTHGAVWADFDNDGDQDLFVSTGTCCAPQLFENQGEARGGVLIDRTTQLGIPDDAGGRDGAWFDYDRDGLLDLLIVNFGKNLMMNQVATGFVNRTTATGTNCLRNNYAQLTDLNDNGLRDMLCIRDGSFPNKAYELTTPTTARFRDITAGLPTAANVIDTVIGDFDGDGLPDIFMVRGSLHPDAADLVNPNKAEVLMSAGADPEGGTGSVERTITFNSTGALTVGIDSVQVGSPAKVFIGANGVHPGSVPFTLLPGEARAQGIRAHNPSVNQGLYIGRVGGAWRISVSPGPKSSRAYLFLDSTAFTPIQFDPPLSAANRPISPRLFKNTGTGWQDRTVAAGLGDAISCVSAGMGDFDNDRDLDLYLVCRTGVRNLANRLYENQGNGTFVLVPAAGGAQGITGFNVADHAGTGDSVAVGDYNVDGFLDMFVTNGLNLQPLHFGGPDQLFRNSGNANNWVELELVGRSSNRDAIGAKVTATAGGVTQARIQDDGYHRWTQNSKRIHLGLGSSTLVDLAIDWPNGGPTQRFTGVAANHLYRLTEGLAGTPIITPRAPTNPALARGDECGEPLFDARLDRAVFLWKNCTTNVWQMRVAAGGSAAKTTFSGTVSSTGAFSAPTPFSLEGGDVVSRPAPGQIQYSLNVSLNAVDGFGFAFPAAATTCFRVTAPAGTRLLVGSNSMVAPLALNLTSLGGC